MDIDELNNAILKILEKNPTRKAVDEFEEGYLLALDKVHSAIITGHPRLELQSPKYQH